VYWAVLSESSKYRGSPPSGLLRGGFDRLVFDVAGEGVVKIPLVIRDLELGGLNVALGEEGFNFAGVRVREGDEGLFDAAQVKRSLLLAHGFFETFDVAVDVAVEQLEEQAKIVGVPLCGAWRS
jgi:hypothetical protein